MQKVINEMATNACEHDRKTTGKDRIVRVQAGSFLQQRLPPFATLVPSEREERKTQRCKSQDPHVGLGA